MASRTSGGGPRLRKELSIDDLLTALALVLVIEGSLYALFPGAMRRVIVEALTIPEGRMRLAGLAAAVAGVGAVWMLRTL